MSTAATPARDRPRGGKTSPASKRSRRTAAEAKKAAGPVSPGASTTLARYAARRDFAVTPEPSGALASAATAPAPQRGFVVQKHWASRLHYDFRLELDGVLVSWAVPKGPSFDPADKRMAVHVEDHPLDYAAFEGTIPPRQYGAGRVIVWDRGGWEPIGDPRQGLADGKLLFRLHGQKLAGLWELVRIAKPGERQDPWILFKKRDAWARPRGEYDVVSALPDSVVERPLGPVEARKRREPGDPDAQRARPPSAGADGTTGVASPAHPTDLSDAPRAPLPATLAPQLAQAATAMVGGPGWSLEPKWDGYRLLARVDARGGVRLFTRNGHDWTDRLSSVADAVAALGWRRAWLDGELVALDAEGRPSFSALQEALSNRRGSARLAYFVFDRPYAEGHDLRALPLARRRRALEAALQRAAAAHGGTGLVRFSPSFDADAAALLEAARRMGVEGLVAKRSDAPYTPGRSEAWLKLKHRRRQEFVVVGYAPRADAPTEVGALHLAVRGGTDAGHWVFAGSVGTGWSSDDARALMTRLRPLRTDTPAVDTAAATARGRWGGRRPPSEHVWVEPALVVEVAFAGWTAERQVRHAVYQGLRLDKEAREVTVEPDPVAPGAAPAMPAGGPGGAGGTRVRGRAVSHPERVVDRTSGLTKLDLVRYYDSVAPWLLKHLRDRPVALVRAPDGIDGAIFFQKHAESTRLPGLRELDPALWPGHAPLLGVPSADAIVAAAQMNVVEFHTGNASVRAHGRPNRIVFDLDPGEGTPWPRVREAALLVRTLLDELGLRAWLKTSGGKGLHVVVPIVAQHDDDAVKSLSQAIVRHLAATVPQRFVAKSGAANRIGKLYVDYLRNGLGATTAAAFSARARPGLGVSMPVDWDALPELKSGAQWTVATAREHLSFQGESDPWADYWTSRQRLDRAAKRLGLEWAPAGRRRPRRDD